MKPYDGSLLTLTGGLKVKARVQHPKVNQRGFKGTRIWFIRYWKDELRPDGSSIPKRAYKTLGMAAGPDKLTEKQAIGERDKFLAGVNNPTVEDALQSGVALFGEVAKKFSSAFLNNKDLCKTTYQKWADTQLKLYIIPRWGGHRLNEIKPLELQEWFQNLTTAGPRERKKASWALKDAVRKVMVQVYKKAEDWGLWEEDKRTPIAKVSIGSKRAEREERILSFEETARVLAVLEPTTRLIVEICYNTSTRIGEVLALPVKNVEFDTDSIVIKQRVWHQEIDTPKTAKSVRRLSIKGLTARLRPLCEGKKPNDYVFTSPRVDGQPLWDSTILQQIHRAAEKVGCDFVGLGPHSFRRANVTWTQEVGGSGIEAGKRAGHTNTNTTAIYTVISLKRQAELNSRIQDEMAKATKKVGRKKKGAARVAAAGHADAAD
jgi:integrase